MPEPGDNPTPEEIARAIESLRKEREIPNVAQSGPGVSPLITFITQLALKLPQAIIVSAAVIVGGYYAWDFYNAARRDPAETQEIMAKAAAAQAEADALNKKLTTGDTVRGAQVEAELEKTRADRDAARAQADALLQKIGELSAAQAQIMAELAKTQAEAATARAEANAQNKKLADGETARSAQVEAEVEKLRAERDRARAEANALTQKIDGLAAADALKQAELEKLRNEVRTAQADADAATGYRVAQAQAELAKTQAEARSAAAGAAITEQVAGNYNHHQGDLFETFYNKVTGSQTQQPQRQPRDIQVAAREDTSPAPEQKPSSLDCVNGRHTGIDFEVCAYPELADAVGQLQTVYRVALASGGDSVKISQRAWWKSYGPSCGLPAKGQPSPALMAQARPCVLSAINRRINDLQNGV